ncbi:hypothetical protein CFHF_11245 [Caulobacter flavus]|uniref:DUF5330 domain-containing protein n=2 Tax=Caulobacter flavus TaxID=1679497 RepID=A0A2N5CU52_9CAUL|nr:hypothetical protein C1707_18270 [Caulobacter flavus]PLR16309.1 hypothetical protein CFHF_11245 [Caulobacter flavus]
MRLRAQIFNPEGTIMRIATILLAAASIAAVAAPALAAERVTDAQFIQANRCLGLTEAKTLGEADAAALKQFIKVQRPGRHVFTSDRADTARSDAKRAAAKADEATKASLIQELDGACKELTAS